MARKNGIRWTPTPDRFEPFWCNGRTHRGAHRIERKGWYFLDGKDKLCGPFDHRVVAQCEAEASKPLPVDDENPYMPLARMMSGSR